MSSSDQAVAQNSLLPSRAEPIAALLTHWHSEQLIVAPHIARQLWDSHRDPRVVIRVAAGLTESQRRGLRPILHGTRRGTEDVLPATARRAAAESACAAELLSRGEALLREGDAESAFRMAHELSKSCPKDEQIAQRSRLLAARAALGACWFEECLEILRGQLRLENESERLTVMLLRLVAETYAHGVIPFARPTRDRPQSDDPRLWLIWARIAGYTACFCAVHGAFQQMRFWLQETREADLAARAEGDIRDPAVAFCWLLSGEDELLEFEATGPFSQGVVIALQDAQRGELKRALRAVRRGETALGDDTDAFIAGFERTPLIRGIRKTVEALLLMWSGRMDLARMALLAGARQYSIAPHFGGTGAALLRRLDIAVLGEPSPFSFAVSGCLSGSHHPDRREDEAIISFLAGKPEEAASFLRIWTERGTPGPCFQLPGLDEVGLIAERCALCAPEVLRSAMLVHDARLLPDSEWQREHADLSESAREIRAPFLRAKVEAALGVSSLVRGEAEKGRRHLRAACSLFDESGAVAWHRTTAHRLHRSGAEDESGDAEDPFEVCRAAWEGVLPVRQLEVALLAVSGVTNREIADRFGISVRTVEVHMGRILAKFEVKNRAELAVLAHRTNRFS